MTAAVAVVLFVLSFVGAAAAAPVVGPSHGSSSARGVASAGPIAVPSGHDPRGFASLLAPFPEIPALPGHLGIHPHVGILVTIYPDGTVSSPSLVATSGYNYTLTGPLIGAILDERNNSVLLSGGYSLTEGVGMTFAVQVNDATNVTVDGMTILSPTVGIDVENSSLVNLNVNYVESASSAGIIVQESSGVSLSDNDASHSNFGIEVVLSSNVALFGDNVTTTGSAIVGEVVSGFTLEYENTAFSGTGLQAIDVTSLGVYQSNF
ncbi:MAG: right-handed parallel beta-helix repeat-containing protein, partial [Thermoplasmata archaeon]|nr:right-handed parallel beta-helix repeat-containing protein [Thermoplasmata archaeon]